MFNINFSIYDISAHDFFSSSYTINCHTKLCAAAFLFFFIPEG
jgi:hypothetical protein